MLPIAIAVASAFLISIITAFFTPVRKYLFGPTLRIFAIRHMTTEEGFHFQVLVTSTGIFSQERAINCRAKITVWPIIENDVFTGNTKLKPINFRSTPAIQYESICWAKKDYPEKLDINESDVETIELALFSIDDRKIIIPSERGWSREGGLDLVHLKPHDYTFHIVVTAENAHRGWANWEFRRPIGVKAGSAPWATFCLSRNILSGFSIPNIPGVFDLRNAGIRK
jgi:hypothetical protein